MKSCPASTLFPAAISAGSSMPRRGRCSSTPSDDASLARCNVVIRDQCRVRELVPSADRRSITGARCERIDGSRETIAADLVVDVSARGALTLAALDAMGRARPPETTVGVDIGYATASLRNSRAAPRLAGRAHVPSAPSDRAAAFCCRSKATAGWSASRNCTARGRPATLLNSWTRRDGCAPAPSTTRSGMRGRRACHSGSPLPKARGGITKTWSISRRG